MSGCQCECSCCTDWDKELDRGNRPLAHAGDVQRLESQVAALREAAERAREWLEYNTASREHWSECEQPTSEANDSDEPTDECNCQYGVHEALVHALTATEPKP